MGKPKLTLEEYSQLENSYRAITSEIEQMTGNNNEIPVCIPSYHYSEERSHLINELLENPPQDGREYYIFCYEEERELYEKMNENNIFKLHFIKEVGTLAEKRQYILDWAFENGYKDIFMFEDDSYNLSLPTLRNTSAFNSTVYMRFEEVLKYWEHLIKKFKFDVSFGMYEDTLHRTKINKRYQIGKGFLPMIHWNVIKFNFRKLHYKNGFFLDDHEMFFQSLKNNFVPVVVFFGQRTNEFNSSFNDKSTFKESWNHRFIVGSRQLEKAYPGKVKLTFKNGKPNVRSERIKKLIELARTNEW